MVRRSGATTRPEVRLIGSYILPGVFCSRMRNFGVMVQKDTSGGSLVKDCSHV